MADYLIPMIERSGNADGRMIYTPACSRTASSSCPDRSMTAWRMPLLRRCSSWIWIIPARILTCIQPRRFGNCGDGHFDTMQYVKAGANSLHRHSSSMGAPARRREGAHGTPNSEVMIHQPSGGAEGQATDVTIRAEWLKTKHKMNRMMAEMTGQALEKIANDVERDFYMSAQDAKAYGIIDEIFEPRKTGDDNG